MMAWQPTGMAGFTLVWGGQLVSLLGSSMSQFALTLWAYEETGQATALALVGFFYMLPLIAVSPIAGALVDRWNRKLTMMVSDFGAALATLFVFVLYSMGSLEVWHLYISAVVSGATQAFQWPAYSAAISTMIPKKHYARANGMMGLTESIPAILAPIAGAVLYASIGTGNLLLLDLITFVAAFATLTVVRIPQPQASQEGLQARGSLLKEAVFGFGYIFKRPSLLGLQLNFLFINLVTNFGFTVLNPMILARTASDATVLGVVQSAGGIGGVVGGVLLSLWGGPKRRVHGVLLGMAGGGLLAGLPLGIGQTVAVWAVANFMNGLIIPILNGSNQAIWQAKVPPDIQGKVFATRRLIAWIAIPLSTLLAGPLADQVFEPAMQPGGALAGLFGGLVGTGPGTGMALMLVITGILSIAVGLLGYLNPWVRNAEDLLPDHDQNLPDHDQNQATPEQPEAATKPST